MISNSKFSYINSLKLTKFRNKHNAFLAEGPRLVEEFLRSDHNIKMLACKQEWLDQFSNIIQAETEVHTVSDRELKKLSNLSTPNNVLAVIQKPEPVNIRENITDDLILILDDIRDPGNLGTIIRLADWYGLQNIYCSKESVDAYNPKVVQSSMGSLCRIKVSYRNIPDFINDIKPAYKIFTSEMKGENIYEYPLPEKTAIIIGNEASGISGGIKKIADNSLAIPSFRKGAESLNASVAAGIIVSEVMRRRMPDV